MEVRVLRNVGCVIRRQQRRGNNATVTNRRELPVPGAAADQLRVRHEIVPGTGSPLEPSKWRYASYATLGARAEPLRIDVNYQYLAPPRINWAYDTKSCRAQVPRWNQVNGGTRLMQRDSFSLNLYCFPLNRAGSRLSNRGSRKLVKAHPTSSRIGAECCIILPLTVER